MTEIDNYFFISLTVHIYNVQFLFSLNERGGNVPGAE